MPVLSQDPRTLTEIVREKILSRIVSHRWGPGMMLPSETELAKLFSVSQGTIRRALRELVITGVLVRQQGRGTFVSSRRTQRVGERLRWFCLEGEEDGKHSTPHQRPVISRFEVINAPDRVAGILQISSGSPVIHFCRDQGYVGQENVYCFDDVFLPQPLFPRLTLEDLIRSDATDLYALYEEICGVTAFRVTEYARAVLLNPEQASKAGVSIPWPAICVQRLSFDSQGTPVELRFLTNVTDKQNMVLSTGRYL